MELKDFQYLIALADEGSVSKAADKLYMSQSSLSQFLQQYEGELGVKLFLRTSKGIHLTANGEVFIGHLRQIVSNYRQARSELWDNEGMKGGHVRFGISSFRGAQTLPKILKQFSAKYPEVHVDVVEEHSLKLEDLLLEGQLDVAVIALPAAKLKNEASLLAKDEVYLVAPKGHPLCEKAHLCPDGNRWISLKEAAAYPLVLSGQNTILGNISRNLLQKAKIKYSAEHEDISAAMAVSMAKAGIGLAFTYASCIDPDDHLEPFRIGEKGIYLNLGVALPTREYHSLAAKALQEIVCEVYRQEN
ncbi:MAG: LysR family transcriptional regulator [Oscillospiraceae bacterium]|nr:LysR family transcriptional regulator [Oscillospiraceae bacterium]